MMSSLYESILSGHFRKPRTRGLLWVVCLVLTFWAGDAAAQAWTMPKGEAYLKLTYGKVDAAEQYTFDGRTTDFIDGLEGVTFKDRSLYLYGELGLSDHVSLVLSLPYKRIFIRDQAFRFRTYAPGTAQLGVRVALLPLLGVNSWRNVLAGNLAVGVPTGYTRNFAPSAGAGQVDLQGMLSYGRSFHPVPGYAQAGVGYRYRSTVYGLSGAVACQPGRDIDCTLDRRPIFADEWFYAVEVGLTPFNNGLLAQVLLNGVQSVQAPKVGFTAQNPIPTRQRYLKLGGGLTLYPFRLAKAGFLEPMGLSLQYFATPSGRNTIHSHDAYLGVEYRTKLF